jgi:uncharacterized membrane protein required for colicin V production
MNMATIVDVIVTVLLVLGFIGGMFSGAVKTFFSLAALVIAAIIAALCYHYVSVLLIFLPMVDWRSFFGFFITLLLIKIIFEILLLIPRGFIKMIWRKGILYRLLGGLFGLLETSIFLAVLALLIQTFPFWNFLEDAVNSSANLEWLVSNLGFVHLLFIGTLGSVQNTY